MVLADKTIPSDWLVIIREQERKRGVCVYGRVCLLGGGGGVNYLFLLIFLTSISLSNQVLSEVVYTKPAQP